MSRSAPSPHSHLVGPLLRFAQERGVRLELPRYNLPAGAELGGGAPIENAQLAQLLDDLAEELDAPNLGLQLPAVLRFERYELPELAARASPTVRDSLLVLTRFASQVHESILFGLSEAQGAARFTHRFKDAPRGHGRHLNEFALASALFHVNARVSASLQVSEVTFLHARPRSLSELERYFGTDRIGFGATENALVFDAKALDAPQTTADPRLLATVEGLAPPPAAASSTFRARVEERIRAQLDVGQLRLRKLAHELHMSSRTLQRRLEEEGTSYAQVVDGVREQRARAWLSQREPLTLSEISSRLGFSEFATFSRAFKRWTGMAPGAFREARHP